MRLVSLLAAAAILLVGCKPRTDPEPKLEPGPLMAGVATARIPAPLGIGTSGYGPFGAPSSPSPFAELYPGTTRLHTHPEIRVVVISRGEGFELVFVRLDSIGVFQQLRRAIVLELSDRLGRDLDHGFFFGGTHTHSGPGRLVAEGGLFDLIADTFFPEFYERLIDAVASAVEEAFADLEPARVGHVMGSAEETHSDRRCEDGTDYTNSSLPIIAVERSDRIEALILAFAVHGTILGMSDLTLSREVPGAIEHAVEELFDHPVHVQMFTSWAGDMAPGNPAVEGLEAAILPGGFDRMEQVGVAVAAAVEEALGGLRLGEEPVIASRSYRTRIDREILGYDEDTFPHPYGALYCNSEADCAVAPTVQEGLDKNCVAFPFDQPAPDQTEFSVGRLGDLHLVTFTGEPVTSLAEYVMEGMRAHDGVEDIMFMGYTQDYMGYSVLEEDWWFGGYEASGTLWGPRQGQHLSDFVIEAFGAFMKGEHLRGQPVVWPPFIVDPYDPYQPATPIGFSELLVDVEAAYGPTDVVVFTVSGGDPWLGAPIAVLERADGTSVTRPGGQPIDSDGYYFWLDLEPDPPYGPQASERRFKWTFSFPVTRRFGLSSPVLEGEYRFRVTLPDGSDGGVVTTSSFEVAR